MHVALARARGATVLGDARRDRDRAAAPTACGCAPSAGEFHAEQVVLCAGAWTRGLLAGLGRRLADPADPGAGDLLRDAEPRRLRARPLPDLDLARRRRRGVLRLPRLRRGGHEGGAGPRRPGGERGARARGEPDRRARARGSPRFVEAILPGYTGPELLHALLPLRHAAGPRLRRRPRARASRGIAVCIGAGHAAKFAGLLGRILSELAIDGATAFPIERVPRRPPGAHRPGASRPPTGSAGVAAAT